MSISCKIRLEHPSGVRIPMRAVAEADINKSLGGLTLYRPDKTEVRYHTCSICGAFAPWSKGWVLWASITELDDGVPVLKFCGAVCASRIPENNIPDIVKAAYRQMKITRSYIMRYGYCGPGAIELEIQL